ncbi:hypothetical protein [Capnocytophaga canimorsus]|uniref:hypothetical protein n=1 Tax=Capnocytophaga canimorsus TaxID=28188 RepID=UPI0037D5DA3C
MKVQGTKLLTAISFFVMVAISLPTTAQSRDKANTLTEQVEKINNEPSLVIQAKKALITYYSEHTDYFHHILTTATNA